MILNNLKIEIEIVIFIIYSDLVFGSDISAVPPFPFFIKNIK